MRSKLSLFIFVLVVCSLSAQSQLMQKIYTLAGNGTAGFSGDGSNASGAELWGPLAVALDGEGSLFICDYNNFRVRKVNAGGLITTIAGTGLAGNTGNGTIGTSAELVPRGVAADKAGNVYISDDASNVIRKVNTLGIISTISGMPGGSSGYYGDGGPATGAWFSAPSGIAFDNIGNLYIADLGNHVVREIDTAGIISTIGGNHVIGHNDSARLATQVSLDSPYAVAVDRYGNVFIDDYGNNVIRKINATNDSMYVYAGILGVYGYNGNGGPATAALLNEPRGLAVDTSGNLYISDAANNVIRMVSASTGIITTVAGDGDYGFGGDLEPAISANLFNPYGIAVDAAGDIYIADANNERIRQTYYPNVGVKNVTTSNSIEVYPNPFSYTVTVIGLESGDKVLFYDLIGRQMGVMREVSTAGPQSFDIADLAPGAYLLKVLNASGSNKYVTRLIKE